MAALKTVAVKVGDAVEQKQDRIRVEVWVAVGGLAIEQPIIVYPCICRSADGQFAEQQQTKQVDFTMTPATAALVLAEVNAAIAKATA